MSAVRTTQVSVEAIVAQPAVVSGAVRTSQVSVEVIYSVVATPVGLTYPAGQRSVVTAISF